jgi:hypothetical protein
MSVDASSFGRKRDVFPVTAPLRPIRPNERDRQMLPRAASSSSGSDAGLISDMGQGDDRSSTRQVSIGLPLHIRKPIKLLLGSLSIKDLSTCILTHKASVTFLPSMLVSRKTCESGSTVTAITNDADDKHDRTIETKRSSIWNSAIASWMLSTDRPGA